MSLDQSELHPTESLADWVASSKAETVDARALRWARHCLLDWIAVTIPGAQEELVSILLEEALADEAEGRVPIVGRDRSLTPSWSVLVNGAAGHALDYDDVNRTMHGHPTVAVMPAVLTAALMEERSLEAALASFVVGYEAACQVGEMVGDGHYDKGWHATATVGTFGAAAGTANLLGLDGERTAHALGTAATMAAGLKSMFGTMSKPLHAGRASQSGYLAARTAARGWVSRPDALECSQGFFDTQSPSPAPKTMEGKHNQPFLIEQNLFKYHAACYMTHSGIEACRMLKDQHHFEPEDVRAVKMRINEGHLKVCNILEPSTGLEIKFSLRHTAALALSGIDTGAIETYSDEIANRDDLVNLRQKVEIQPQKVDRTMSAQAEVEIELNDGRTFEKLHDVAVPATDLDDQEQRLSQKFDSLVCPILGDERAAEIKEMVLSSEREAEIVDLLKATMKG